MLYPQLLPMFMPLITCDVDKGTTSANEPMQLNLYTKRLKISKLLLCEY